MLSYPPLPEVDRHSRAMGAALRAVSIPGKIVTSIQTKALRTGRKVTGTFQTNRSTGGK